MPERRADRVVMQRWGWTVGVCATVALIILLVLVAPGSMALYETYWGKESIRGLFYEDLGFSYSWSSFIAIVGSFFYGLAWVPQTAWTFRVLIWRFNTRQLATAFGCWVLVYGHVPLLEALLGSDNCFNQRTGVALKWYVEDPNGQVTLFDSAGFDTVTRAEKQPVTPDVCRAFALQKNKEQPRRITAGLKDVEFFDPNNGRAKVWYSKAADGSFALYDRSGFDPVTSDPLHPVTKDIVAGLMTADLDRQRAETAATEAQAREAAKQREQEQQRADAEKRRADQEAQRAAEISRLPQCGGVYESRELTNAPQPINGGADCNMDWEIKWGKVRFTTIDGTFVDVSAGEALRDHSRRFIAWQALGKSAIIHAVFCPRNTHWDGEKCS